MSNLQQVEEAVLHLSPAELAQFRDWFSHFDTEIWDRELEQDVEAGRLDALADEALRDLREGRCTDLCGDVYQQIRSESFGTPQIVF